jgi:2'-hydroxyisoflavone reductase
MLSVTALLAISPISCVKNEKKKNALILGGRGFLGPTIVTKFLEAGYNVTLLNRGKTNPYLFKDLPIIICDREKENQEDLKEVAPQIQAKQWDVVIDTWSKNPLAVQDFLSYFSGNINHYHYTSSIAVYAKWDETISENTITRELSDKKITYKTEMPYAFRKVYAENFIEKSGVNFTIHRSHGMRDYRIPEVNDEPYWPVKFFRGKPLFVPQDEGHVFQITDVVTYVNFMVHTSKKSIYGIFNVANKTFPFESYISTLMALYGKPEELHHIPKDFLLKHKIEPYKSLPMWRPEPYGFYHIDVTKAMEHGHKERPLAELLKEQVEGYTSRNPNNDFVFGEYGTISQERTEEIIELWKIHLEQS